MTVDYIQDKHFSKPVLVYPDDRVIKTIEVLSKKPIHSYIGHKGFYNECISKFEQNAFTLILSANYDKLSKIWNPISGKCLKTLNYTKLAPLKISAIQDKKARKSFMIVLVDETKQILILDFYAQTTYFSFEVSDNKPCNFIAWYDSKLRSSFLACGFNGYIQYFTFEKREILNKFESQPTCSISYCSELNTIVSADIDCNVSLINLNSNKHIRFQANLWWISGAKIINDGKEFLVITSGGPSPLKIFNLFGKELRRFSKNGEAYQLIAFNEKISGQIIVLTFTKTLSIDIYKHIDNIISV